MRVSGVITEYNPFHNGHRYQLDQIRKITGADYIIVAMSGDFVQRGAPALMDKYARAQMALLNGADLVIELPCLYATASAEFFAGGGVSTLLATGVLNYLCFGAESTELGPLNSLARTLVNEDNSFKEKLNQCLKEGMSFPAARAKALDISEAMLTPNNILAIEYLKALHQHNSPVKPVLIPRVGDSYSSSTVSSSMASATAIRGLVQDGHLHEIADLVPEYNLIYDYYMKHGFANEEAFSQALHYRLLTEKEEGFSQYADCSQALSHKIVNSLPEYENFDQFCQLLKSRDMTYSRISRALLHIYLGITKEDYEAISDNTNYLRILGFRKSAAPLLSAIKKEATAPLISKVADASSLITKDLLAADLYNSLLAANHKEKVANDFVHPLAIIP